jgi:hypothetical protein
MEADSNERVHAKFTTGTPAQIWPDYFGITSHDDDIGKLFLAVACRMSHVRFRMSHVTFSKLKLFFDIGRHLFSRGEQTRDLPTTGRLSGFLLNNPHEMHLEQVLLRICFT